MANGKDHLKDEGAGKEQVKPLVNKQIFYDLWEQDMPELAAEREKLEKMTEERLGEDEAGYLSLQVDEDCLLYTSSCLKCWRAPWMARISA